MATLALVAGVAGLSAPIGAIPDDKVPNDLKPAPGGSFPWGQAAAPDTLYDGSAGVPGPGGSFAHELAVAPPALYDRNVPLPKPGGRFGTRPGRNKAKS